MGKVGMTTILKTQLEMANATIRELTLRLESVTKTMEEQSEQEKRREEERKARGSDGGRRQLRTPAGIFFPTSGRRSSNHTHF